MFNILSLKDFKLNKMRIALPKDEEKSQYGNLIILNTKDLQGNQKIITNPFINKLSVYNQIYRDMKFTFKVRGKSINKRELKERLADYKIYKETNDLKGIVVFNSNQGKNMYYDISRFNQLFFEATIRENHTMKYIDYINILKEHILNQEFFKYYTNKIMIIDVENWMVTKVDTNKETSFDNPLNLLYYAMKKDFETFKTLGDIEFIITSSNAMFRFNPIRCNGKSFNEFRRELNKIGKNLINEEELPLEDAVADKSLKIIDQGSKKDTEITTTGQSLVNNPEVVNAVIKASDKAKDTEGTEQNKIDSVVSDPKVLDAVKKQVMEPVNIKTDAMSKRDMELREAQKQVKISGSNETIYDLMQKKASKVEIPVNDVSSKVRTLNKNMTTIKFPNFASAYNEHLYHKDITSIAYSMQDKSIPVYIRSIDKEDTSDSLNLKQTWTFNLEDENRRRHTLKFDIPIFIDDRYVFLNGNKKEFNNQRFLKPLVKTGPDTVQVCTNYNKIFMTRYGENVESKFEKFKQMVLTDRKRFSYKKGNCSRVNSEYKTTIEYDTLAKMFTEISCKNKSGKIDLTLVFNQNKLKDYCLANPKLKDSYEYYTKNDALVVGYTADKCLAIDPDTQLIIDSVAKTTKEGFDPVTEAGVNLWVINRVKEIDAEIEALRDGDNADRIDALTTEKDRILMLDGDNNAGDIDKYLRNDDIKTMEESYNLKNLTVFYHGSDVKLDVVTPTSPNLGNMLESEKWVCYLWKDKDRAIKFAVQKVVRNYIRGLNMDTGFKAPRYNIKNGKSMLLNDQYQKIKDLIVNAHLKAYVHKVDVSIRSLGFGHSSGIDEFTSTDKLPVDKVYTINIDNDVFDRVFESGDEKDSDRLKTYATGSLNRGLLAYIMHDQKEIFKREMKIKHGMAIGDVKVGDDLSLIAADESYLPVMENTKLNLLFNDEDICVNLQQFFDKKSSVLFISGLSGSGKTNMSINVVEYTGCDYVGLDLLDSCDDDDLDRDIHRLLFKYLKSKGITTTDEIHAYACKLRASEVYDYNRECGNYVKWVIKQASPNHQVVIEGIQISTLYRDYKKDIFKKYSMVLISTPLLLSFMRRINRDRMDFISDLPRYIGLYADWYDSQNRLRRDVSNDNNIRESFNPVMETLEGSIGEDDDGIEDSGIVNYVIAMYAGDMDLGEFAKYKSGKRFMYTRCKVMKKNIPLIVFLAYCEGLSTVLRKAGIRYMFSDKRPRLEGYDSVNKGIVQFADGYLIYDKYPLEKSLLMNGLTVVDTKNIEYADLDTKNAYLDIFDKLFGSRILSNALDNFYEWMIDAPTAEILDDLNYPTEFVGLLLAGNKLLADNNYRDEIDMSNWRIRNNELVYAYAYKRIADAYTKYRMTSENKNPVKISIPKDAILKDIMMSQIVEDVSELSPIVDVEKSHTVTDKGPSGTNLEQAYTQERRCFHPSMTGVMAISTSPDANVGLVRELTLEPNIINARGYVAQKNDKELNDVNLFSAAELATPMGVTKDDTIRTAMASKQSGLRSIYG